MPTQIPFIIKCFESDTFSILYSDFSILSHSKCKCFTWEILLSVELKSYCTKNFKNELYCCIKNNKIIQVFYLVNIFF